MKILGVSMLPVCQHDRLVGTVTARDITVRAVAKGFDAEHTPVAEIMTEETVYCFEDQEIDEAAQLMRDRQVRQLPVLNRESRLVGIISLSDLAAYDGYQAIAGEVLGRIAVGTLAG